MASLLALAALPASAAALVLGGSLAALPGASGCVRDQARNDAAGCYQGIAGLQGAAALALSPDNRNLYVASPGSDAVVTLARRRSGGLAPQLHPSRLDCVSASGTRTCARSAPGLAGADALAVSPDGRYVYVGSADAGAVVVFARGRHGLLERLREPKIKQAKKPKQKPTQHGFFCLHGQGVVAGAAGSCAGSLPALQRVGALATSPDGQFVYALSSGNQAGEDTLVGLHREANGTLRPLRDCVSSHGGSRRLCAMRATGMRGASSLVISPDGRFAYVASILTSTVTVFVRNRSSGGLSPLRGAAGCGADPTSPPSVSDPPCAQRIAGLRGARALALSPDASRLYVAGFDPGSLLVLARDAQSGGIGPVSADPTACLEAGPGTAGCSSDLIGLHGAGGLAVAPAGDRLFASALGDDAVLDVRFASNGLPALPLAPFNHFAALGGPQALVLSRDGRNLYVASPVDDEVIAIET
ncbi:MAG: hypothetical protein NVSMB51_10660 [Solirubrobacteraceae bacterium]